MRLLATVALLSALPAVRLAAQAEAGPTLVIRQGGQEVGQESFTLRDTRNRGLPGTMLLATARYPKATPPLQLTAQLERKPDLAVALFVMEEVRAPADTMRIFAVGDGAKLILRTTAKGSETGRQLPGGPDIVLLDDSVFSLYVQVADLATPAGRSLTAVFPRTGRRLSFAARREVAAGGGNTRVTLTGGLTGTLVVDAQGRVIRLELPASQTVVTRADE